MRLTTHDGHNNLPFERRKPKAPIGIQLERRQPVYSREGTIAGHMMWLSAELFQCFSQESQERRVEFDAFFRAMRLTTHVGHNNLPFERRSKEAAAGQWQHVE